MTKIQKRRWRRARKALSLMLALSVNLLPLQGLMPVAQASDSSGINIPSAEQPQVLIILDNSQGMAGLLQATQSFASSTASSPVISSQLSGPIMTGSGTVSEDTGTSSPPYYQTSNFPPPVQGSVNSRNLYSVPCSSGALNSLGQQACSAFGVSGSSNSYVDNSPSLFNAAEGAIRSMLSVPLYANNIQLGLETYATQSPGYNQSWVYNTWVYYMSGANGFSFGNSASPGNGLTAVANPCYGSVSNGYFTNNSCYYISSMSQNSQTNGYVSSGSNLGVSGLYNDPYLYIQDTSDNPIINDVFYAQSGGSGSGSANNVQSGGPQYSQGQSLNLYNYNTQNVYSFYDNSSNQNYNGSSPTSAGYIPLSPQVWNSQRGLAFNSSITGAGTIVSPITSATAKNASAITKAIYPEVLSPNLQYQSTPITASAGYAPVAGAFQTAISYFSSNNKTNAPPPTCGQKYVIFITFGQPTQALNGDVYPPLGSASANLIGVNSISSATDWKNTNNAAVTDAITQIGDLYKDGVKTYVLGVGSAVDPNVSGLSASQKAVAQQGGYVLQAMATAGGTNTVFSAATDQAVQSALNGIISNILGKSVISSYAAPPTVGVGSLEFLLKNLSPITGQGDLYAYAVTSTGALNSTASWDANTHMSSTTRATNLYTTPLGAVQGAGAPVTLTTAATNSPAVFGSNTSPSAATIAQYTIDPSYSNGQYLGGRQSGWFVGLPAGNIPAQVLVAPSVNSFLMGDGSTSSYATFASKHSARQNAVLFADNDGFLYALGYNTTGSPTLLWGWMPGSLLSGLHDYDTFWQGNNMGGFSTINAYNGTKWHTYVVGSAQNGASIYDLQLTGTSAPNLGTVMAQYALPGYAQPQPSAPVFYQVQNPSASNFGTAWALFALNTTSKSYLGVLNVGTGADQFVQLPFANTATPYLDAYGDLFLGSATGVVYEMNAATVLSTLTTKNVGLLPSTDFTTVGTNFAPWAGTGGQNVQFIGGTIFQGSPYLRVQGPTGISIYRQGNNTWSPVWTTYAGGAGIWSANGSYTAQKGSASSSGVNYVLPLPSGSTISDQALIAAGNVIVPVETPAPSSSGTQACGYPTAAYYTFGLAAGATPSGAFVGANGKAFPQVAVIGRYNAYTPTLTIFNGRALLQSAASQNTQGGTSSFTSAFAAGLPLFGPISWRLVTFH